MSYLFRLVKWEFGFTYSTVPPTCAMASKWRTGATRPKPRMVGTTSRASAIEIDIPARSIHLAVDDATLAKIRGDCKAALAESGIKEGLVLVNAMHITASVFINDDESGLHHDYEVWLEKLAPEKPYSQYQHNGFEDNADAHLKRSVMGREVVVAVTNGKLDFGPWEQIFYGEFDGKRKKRVLVKIIGE